MENRCLTRPHNRACHLSSKEQLSPKKWRNGVQEMSLLNHLLSSGCTLWKWKYHVNQWIIDNNQWPQILLHFWSSLPRWWLLYVFKKVKFYFTCKIFKRVHQRKGKGRAKHFHIHKTAKAKVAVKNIRLLVILSFDIKLFNTYSIVTEGMPIVIRKNALTFGCKKPRYVLTMVTIKTWNFNGFIIFLYAIKILEFLRKFLL